jgi:hypothetical protein
MVQHLPVHGIQCFLDTSHMGTGIVVQYGDILHEYARPSFLTHTHSDIQRAFCHEFCLVTALSSKELNGDLSVLPGQILHLEYWHVTLFSYSPMCPLCYTYCGQLLVCHACNHMAMSNWLSLLVTLQKGFT